MMLSSSLRSLFLTEVRLFMREPFAVFFTLMFPVLLLFIFGSAYGDEQNYPGYFGFKGIDVFVPQLVAQVASYLGMMGIPIAFAEYRDMGVFRRFRAAPVRLRTFLTAHMLVELMMMTFAISVLMLATAVAFELFVGGMFIVVVAAVLGGAVCMFSIGLAVAALVGSPRTAQAAGAGVFFPMLFLSGVALPRVNLPPALIDVGNVLPMTRVVDVITHAWVGADFGAYQWSSLLIMAAYTAAALAIAGRWFRWS
jgi:ABC-2 type transport system permease protein